MHSLWLPLVLATMCCAASCQSTPQPALAIVQHQAESVALKEAPGSVITNAELVKRDEHWMWVFQAIMPGLDRPQELLVNARTGDFIPKHALAQHEMEVTR
jgi:uncharacterized membrane protein YkoI